MIYEVDIHMEKQYKHYESLLCRPVFSWEPLKNRGSSLDCLVCSTNNQYIFLAKNTYR